MKKISLATIGALAFSAATVLVVRNLPNSNPQMVTASPANTTRAAPAQLGGPASSTVTAGDPDLFKKIVQRHDEQARARQAPDAAPDRARWDKEVADFDDSMQDEPGVKKFSVKREATLAPGSRLGRHWLAHV